MPIPLVPLDSNHALFANEYLVTIVSGGVFIWSIGQWQGPFADIEQAGYAAAAR